MLKKQQPPKTTSSLKKTTTEYSKLGDTTRIKYPTNVSANGTKTQLTKVLVNKKKKIN